MDLAIDSIILIGILIRRREAMCGVWWSGEAEGRMVDVSLSLSLSLFSPLLISLSLVAQRCSI
jgi:hypothetical protein